MLIKLLIAFAAQAQRANGGSHCGKEPQKQVIASFRHFSQRNILIIQQSFLLIWRFHQRHSLVKDNFLNRSFRQRGVFLINSSNGNRSRLVCAAVVIAHYLHCLTDLERISDHAVNLAELASEMDSKSIAFPADGLDDLTQASNAVREIVALAQKALSEEDMSTARKVEPLEEVISSMLERMKLRHIRRLQNGACTLEMGFILNDIITNFERVAAHCSNVALAVLELRYSDLQFHDYTRGVRQGDQPEFRQWLTFYQDKYLVPLSSPEGNG